MLPRGRFRLGANFWSRHAGPRTWSRVDHAALSAELARARGIGLDLLRVFAFIPDFVDGEHVREAPLARLRAFAEEAARLGVQLLPSPLVGHMSGENFHLPAPGDDPLAPGALSAQVALVGAVARALAGTGAVLGYALTNEAPLWVGVHEGRRAPAELVIAWADRLLAAARAADPGVPVGLGDGMMTGFPNAALAARVDFVGPHVYYGDVDAIRQAHGFDYALALAARFNRPLLLEEFGGSSSQAGAREQAALWSEAIFAAFTAGAAGAIGWCWSDFPVESVGREVPYVHHGFELGFGITDERGENKAAADTVSAWRRLVDGLPDAPPVAAPQPVTLVRSSWLERDYPFSWFDGGAAALRERTAYTLARQAGLRPTLRDEGQPLDGELLLVPSTQRLLVSTWLALLARVENGATLYWSYQGGDHLFHQGTWCPVFERLTGCRHHLRFGCFDRPPALLTLDGALRDMPPLPTGVDDARGAGLASIAYLPIEPIDSAPVEVLSRDRDGRAMLIEHRVGRGRVLFCAAPIEQYAAALPDASQRGVCALYRCIAARAQIDDPFALRSVDLSVAERIDVAQLSVGGGTIVAVMNRSWEPVALPSSLRRAPRWSWAPLGEAGPGQLAPKQTLVIDG